MIRKALTLAALASLAACVQSKPEAAATPPPFVMTSAYKQQVAAIGHKLEAQDRAAHAEQRARMARVIDARVLQTVDDSNGVAFLLQIRNKSGKTIRTLGEAFEIHDAAGHRIGLLEVDDASVRAAPHATVQLWQRERYTRFGDETADMRLAQGKQKRTKVSILQIVYANGSTAGGEDE